MTGYTNSYRRPIWRCTAGRRWLTSVIAYPYRFLDAETSDYLDSNVLFVGNGFPGKSFNFSVLRNSVGNQFRFESQQIPFDSPTVRALYSSALNFQKCSYGWDKDPILQNTELTVESDHLVIITRLPRGSLKTLLLSDAK